jgi:non-specific serine/threonine protein kinase
MGAPTTRSWQDSPVADPMSADRSRLQPVPLAPIGERDRLGAPLPVPLTGFVGRAWEVAEVCAFLRGGARLLTLTGPGGVGKTRLAVRVAAELAPHFPAGVAFVGFASVADPALVLPTVAQALGLREGGDRPLLERLGALLGERRLLLVLDNLEHLADASPDLAALLAACPSLTILATSRVVLRLSSEQVYPVSPLALPDVGYSLELDEVAGHGAVALFVQRARASDPGFALTAENAPVVVEIVRRLDGLPLAIELAAARTRSLTPAALLARLSDRLRLLTGGARDLPDRQRTMRDTIAWSHDLLDPPEQALFRHLAVFAGGFTLEAVEAVCAIADVDVLAGLAALVDQSLVQREDGPGGEPRYRMLETIREFGLERLAAHGEEAATRDRHVAWCLDATAAPGAALWTTYDPGIIERLEAEHANLRAALAWLERTGQGEGLLRLAAALGSFWMLVGHHREGYDWLKRALAAAPDTPTSESAHALCRAGEMAGTFDGDEAAIRQLEQAAVLARRLDLPVVEASAVVDHGSILEDRGDYDGAEARFTVGLARFRQAGAGLGASIATYHLGVAAYGRGDAARSAGLWEEALAEARALGQPVVAAWCLGYLGLLAAERGEPGRAATFLGESWALHEGAAFRHHHMLADLAVLGAACGQAEAATRLLGAAEAAQHGNRFDQPEAAAYARVAERLRETLGMSAYELAVVAGRNQRPEAVNADAATVLAAAATAPPNPARDTGLTPRELNVLRLVADGRSDREIAEALYIGRGTVHSHLASIYGKLDVGSRTAAVAAGRRLGIL